MKKNYAFKENLEFAIVAFLASVGTGTLIGLFCTILCNVMYG